MASLGICSKIKYFYVPNVEQSQEGIQFRTPDKNILEENSTEIILPGGENLNGLNVDDDEGSRAVELCDEAEDDDAGGEIRLHRKVAVGQQAESVQAQETDVAPTTTGCVLLLMQSA